MGQQGVELLAGPARGGRLHSAAGLAGFFYADLAYKFDTYKSDFYPFYNDINGLVTPPTTEVTNTRSKVLFTLGMRF